ncbi:hypothetical protein CPT_Mendera_103 [Stenotrophomonas phage Mendera]|uniref:Uncharacterized protein n=1 Tax=Stenotrophomonas phage Mendera TaxID=2650877 RepID=A0A5P8PIT9_9CAUD|nr:hypothetical protein HWC60_gp103 [Stenotrophomonas phage Mendera]QFR56652.1 hypothetical protein CPT_Mendera_103 [Stenotrophomonas phage Mendera]
MKKLNVVISWGKNEKDSVSYDFDAENGGDAMYLAVEDARFISKKAKVVELKEVL